MQTLTEWEDDAVEQAWEFVAASWGEHGVAIGDLTMAPDATQERDQQGTRMLVTSSEFQSQRI